jgi:hypothetical protein
MAAGAKKCVGGGEMDDRGRCVGLLACVRADDAQLRVWGLECVKSRF